jgi:hypothetical protein
MVEATAAGIAQASPGERNSGTTPPPPDFCALEYRAALARGGAACWNAPNRPESPLLRGENLDAANPWFAKTNEGRAFPHRHPTDVIAMSKQVASIRLGKNRAQLEAMAHAQTAMSLEGR